MRNEEKGSVVAVGWTDGQRFIAIKPPLSGQESDTLHQQNLLNSNQVEQIDRDPVCSLVRFSVGVLSPERSTRRVQGLALAIADALRSTRNGLVDVELEPVVLTGYQSSPFNPNTDRLPVEAV